MSRSALASGFPVATIHITPIMDADIPILTTDIIARRFMLARRFTGLTVTGCTTADTTTTTIGTNLEARRFSQAGGREYRRLISLENLSQLAPLLI